MQLMAQTDRRFAALKLKVWIFTLFSVLTVVGASLFIALKTGYFDATTTLHTLSPSGEGIHTGMPVKLSGLTIGRVTAMELVGNPRKPMLGSPKGASLFIRVSLAVETEYMKWIKSDSAAMLRKEGMVGDPIIEIFSGSRDSRPLQNDDYIKFEREKSITDYAADITAAIEQIKSKANSFFEYINDPEGDIKEAIRHLNKFWSDIHETRNQITDLLTNMDSRINEITKEANRVTDKTTGAMGQFHETMEYSNEAISQLVENVNGSIDKLNDILEEMKTLTEVTVEKAPELLDKGGEVADSAKEVTESLKKVWPIQGNIETPRTKTLPVKSDE